MSSGIWAHNGRVRGTQQRPIDLHQPPRRDARTKQRAAIPGQVHLMVSPILHFMLHGLIGRYVLLSQACLRDYPLPPQGHNGFGDSSRIAESY